MLTAARKLNRKNILAKNNEQVDVGRPYVRSDNRLCMPELRNIPGIISRFSRESSLDK